MMFLSTMSQVKWAMRSVAMVATMVIALAAPMPAGAQSNDDGLVVDWAEENADVGDAEVRDGVLAAAQSSDAGDALLESEHAAVGLMVDHECGRWYDLGEDVTATMIVESRGTYTFELRRLDPIQKAASTTGLLRGGFEHSVRISPALMRTTGLYEVALTGPNTQLTCRFAVITGMVIDPVPPQGHAIQQQLAAIGAPQQCLERTVGDTLRLATCAGSVRQTWRLEYLHMDHYRLVSALDDRCVHIPSSGERPYVASCATGPEVAIVSLPYGTAIAGVVGQARLAARPIAADSRALGTCSRCDGVLWELPSW